jgi:hypothetical protein
MHAIVTLPSHRFLRAQVDQIRVSFRIGVDSYRPRNRRSHDLLGESVPAKTTGTFLLAPRLLVSAFDIPRNPVLVGILAI